MSSSSIRTPMVYVVPRVVSTTGYVRTLTHGSVQFAPQQLTQLRQEAFGPLDWVRFMKRWELPRPVSKRGYAGAGYAVSGILVFIIAILAVTQFPKGGSTGGHALIWMLILLVLAIGAGVAGASVHHPDAPDVAGILLSAGFGIQDVHQRRWLSAGLNGAVALSGAARVHERRHSVRELQIADAGFWATLASHPVQDQWEAAVWYYNALVEQYSQLAQIELAQVPVPDYPTSVSLLRQSPQAW